MDNPEINNKPVSLHSYNAPTAGRDGYGDGVVAVLHTGERTLVIKGTPPNGTTNPLWAADTSHIKAICALMYTGLNDDAIHDMHVAVVSKMLEHMSKRATDTMATIHAINVALAESQYVRAELQSALNDSRQELIDSRQALIGSGQALTEARRIAIESQRVAAESQRVAAELQHALTESQQAQAALSARVAKLESTSDAQFDWAYM